MRRTKQSHNAARFGEIRSVALSRLPDVVNLTVGCLSSGAHRHAVNRFNCKNFVVHSSSYLALTTHTLVPVLVVAQNNLDP